MDGRHGGCIIIHMAGAVGEKALSNRWTRTQIRYYPIKDARSEYFGLKPEFFIREDAAEMTEANE